MPASASGSAPPPAANKTDVFQAELDVDPAMLARCLRILTADELELADRRRTRELRARFIVARAFVRSVLALRTGAGAAQLKFARGPHGKPALDAAGLGAAPPEFNLSHAGGLAVLAVNNATAVGIDVEELARPADHDALARRFFAPAEQAALRALPPARQAAGFVATWTRKEAFLKGLGAGLALPLDQFAVSADPDRRPELLSVAFAPDLVRQWSLHTVPASAGYYATLAVAAPVTEMCRLAWSCPRGSE